MQCWMYWLRLSGIKTMGWTLYSSFMLSFYSSMFEKLFPMSRPLTDDTLLELCFAVALPALASGIVFNIGHPPAAPRSWR